MVGELKSDVELAPALKLTVSVGGDERRAHRPLFREVLRVLHECGVGGATLSPQDQSEVESRLDVVGAKIQRLTQGGFSVGKPAASQRRARPSTPGGEVAHVMRRLRSREYT